MTRTVLVLIVMIISCFSVPSTLAATTEGSHQIKAEALFNEIEGETQEEQGSKVPTENKSISEELLDRLNPFLASLLLAFPFLLIVESERAIENRLKVVKAAYENDNLADLISSVEKRRKLLERAKLEYSGDWLYVVPPYVFENLNQLEILDLKASSLSRKRGKYIEGGE